MAFENSKFGYAGGATTVSSPLVSNHYGQREVKKSVGHTSTEGFMNELTIDLDGDMATAGAFPLLAPVIPAGARIEDVFLVVDEVFVMGGTNPVLEVGTEGSEATNGVTLEDAELEAVGTYSKAAALSGTWAAGLAADTTVGLALGGTSPTSTSAGKARLVIRYVSAKV